MNDEKNNKPQEELPAENVTAEMPVEESIAAKRLAHFAPEIKEGDGAEAVLAREPGFFGFIKHMWYHHKFGILVTVFILVVGVIGVQQCATRNKYDLDLLYAGPWFECDTAVSTSGIHEAFMGVMSDYDRDGQKNLAYTPLFLLSQEQLEQLREENASKPEEERIFISSNLLKQNRDLLDAGVMTGEMSLCLLDPTIYQYFRENNLLDELSHYVDESLLPAGTNLEGYGVYVKDTAFGQYFGTLQKMPADTILCVRRAGKMNQAWGPENYEEWQARYANVLQEILTFQVPQS